MCAFSAGYCFENTNCSRYNQDGQNLAKIVEKEKYYFECSIYVIEIYFIF